LNLITIGEAAGRIVSECKEFASSHPEIPLIGHNTGEIATRRIAT
jgi:uncharacterized protein with HEPN domain